MWLAGTPMAGVGVGGKLVGPIAVDAGTVVKVLDDVCGAPRRCWTAPAALPGGAGRRLRRSRVVLDGACGAPRPLINSNL